MNSFFKYSQNNNFNLIVRNSLIFTLYNKKVNKQIYFKSNNFIKGFYKDPILNDFIYVASNNLKKNISFRQAEVSVINNFKSNNFISYFSKIEDNFLISNIYPNKYLNDLITKSFKDKKFLINWQKEKLNKSLNILNDIKQVSYSSLNVSKILFIKNTYKNFYILNNFGLSIELNRKIIQHKIFSGLFYIFPKNIKLNFRKLFSIIYLILNFYSNLSFTTSNRNLVKQNIILYTLYLNYIKFNLNNYFLKTKLKFRKNNWFLKKYHTEYLKPLNNLINFLYLLNNKNLKKKNSNLYINNILYFNNFFIKQFSWNKFKNNVEYLSSFQKVLILKYLLFQINANIPKNINLILNDKILYQYLFYKFINYNNYVDFQNIKLRYQFTNFINLFLIQLQNSKIKKDSQKINIIDNKNYQVISYDSIMNQNIIFKNLKTNLRKFKFLKRKILKKKKNKQVLNQRLQILKHKKLSILNKNYII